VYIFGPRWEEIAGSWMKLYKEGFHEPYSPANIIRVIRSRKMRWAVHVERMGGEQKYVGAFGEEN
jgi:hypothetical protein